ncbi:MAG: RedB protein, partial [Acidobacteriota bacterium]|nr:RedB protein [Acidobacteriota bacterium]
SWTKAQHLENVTVSWDDGGAEAKRFGATTSGSVLLYSSKGELLFAGGVTASRGHVGENFGLSRLQAALQTGHPDDLLSPIFGCGLTSSKLRRAS